jgi:uncharacterized protein (TIGR02996 family)
MMTTDESFLQAIRAELDDDAGRLIYADWLQEQDDPARVERGEFIRVQCELARLSPDDSRRVNLETRAEALVARHWEAWIGPLRRLIASSNRVSYDAFPRKTSLVFQRGFIEDVTLPAPAFLAGAADLFRLTPLRRLGLTGAGPHAAALADSPYLAELEALKFVDYYVDPLDAAGVRHLAASPHLKRLRSLSLYNNNLGPAGAEALAAAPWLASLIHLYLGACGLGDAGVEALLANSDLAGLNSLGLSDNSITDRGASVLARAPSLRGLRNLDLSRNGITSAGRRELLGSPHFRIRPLVDLKHNPCTLS